MRALALACALAFSCSLAYGHGIGSELLPAQDAGGMSVAVEITGAAADGDYQAEFTFRTLEDGSGDPVPRVTYQIRAVKGSSVLVDGAFETASGTLVLEMEDAAEAGTGDGGGLFGFLGDRRVRVAAPGAGAGGLYQFDIRLLEVGSRLAEPPYWRGGVSLMDVQDFAVRTGYGLQEVRHLSYYDAVEDLAYRDGRIEFSMPFEGTADVIEQTATVHEEVRISKEFGDLMVSEISVEVNGEKMPRGAVLIDDFAQGYRTVHIVLNRDHLEGLYEAGRLGSVMDFSVGPAGGGLPFSTVTYNGQYRIIAEVEPRPAAPGASLDVSYRIEDVFIRDRPVAAAHRTYAEWGGERFFERDGVSRGDGGYDRFSAQVPGSARGVMHVGFESIGGSALAEVRLPVLVGGMTEQARSAAQLWADGRISDGEFLAAMGHPSGDEDGVPEWVRGNARLWAGGLISDGEFADGIGYLVSAGIVGAG